MHLFLTAILISIFSASPLLLLAKPVSKPAQGEKFRLIHADKLFLSKVNDENIMELNGNVHFYYGKTEFRSVRAYIFDTQKIARLQGNVFVQNDTLSATADSISYYRIPNILNLGGKVVITERKRDGTFNQFRSDYGVYDKKNDTITTWSQVQAYSLTEKVRATCGSAFWDRKNGFGYLMQKPELWSEGTDTLYVKSEKMEYFDLDRKVVATFDVLTTTGDYNTASDFLLYFLKEDKAVFLGEPRFSSDFSDAQAVEFYLYFKERKLTRAELKDSCLVYFAETKQQPKTNWVKAAFISMNFAGENLSDFSAEKEVTYFYQQEKQEKKDYFANSAIGENLSATFEEDGKLKQMKMRNNIKGTYRFEKTP
jgi:lipopolysaccharide export system protein LptA